MLALALLLASAPTATHDDDARPRALVLDLQGDAVSAETRRSITGLVVVKLTKDPRLDVVSGQELKGLADLAAEKQSVGCDDACLLELAGAMDARLVVTGFVGKLGSLIVVNLSLFDAEKARAVGRSTIEAESVEQLPGKLDRALDEMLAALPKRKPRVVPSSGGPPVVALGLIGGGAVGALVGVGLGAVAVVLATDASSARAALDDESAAFNGNVDALRDAHDDYAAKRDTWNDVGPLLGWSGAVLAVAAAVALGAGGALWAAE